MCDLQLLSIDWLTVDMSDAAAAGAMKTTDEQLDKKRWVFIIVIMVVSLLYLVLSVMCVSVLHSGGAAAEEECEGQR